jgi:hypothetical protein
LIVDAVPAAISYLGWMQCMTCSQPAAWCRTSGPGSQYFCDAHARGAPNFAKIAIVGFDASFVWYRVLDGGKLGHAITRVEDFTPPAQRP